MKAATAPSQAEPNDGDEWCPVSCSMGATTPMDIACDEVCKKVGTIVTPDNTVKLLYFDTMSLDITGVSIEEVSQFRVQFGRTHSFDLVTRAHQREKLEELMQTQVKWLTEKIANVPEANGDFMTGLQFLVTCD